MAEVARKAQPDPDIDYHLDYQFRHWLGIPEYAACWPEMDAGEQEVFDLEWKGITESRLAQLSRWAVEGCLTPPQQARYGELMQLVTRYRPLVARLLDDSSRTEAEERTRNVR
jgi:hypothetical protein